MKPTVSIVIPIYNRLEVSKKGISYIYNSRKYYSASKNSDFQIEIIVVDDGSTDGSGQWVKDNYPDLTVIYGDGNLWWTGAVNEGIKYSLNTFNNLRGIILQNDDIMVDDDWLVSLLRDANMSPNSLIGCATALQEDQQLIQYGGRLIHPWFAKEKKINYKALRTQFVKGHTSESFDLYGRGLFIPTNVFKQIGIFDHKSFKHRGDMDLPLRAKKVGFKLLISYDAIVYELPQLTFNLDVKPNITLKEAYKILTDFRSSSNLKFIYNYSKIATNSHFQFAIFLSSNIFYHLRGVLWRLVRRHVYSNSIS